MKIFPVAAAAVVSWLAMSAAQAAVAAGGESAPVAMTAEQIVDKSVAVRGGLEAWRKIATIIWTGHLESERSPVPRLPFRLEEKRPGKSRFEVTEPSQRSLRVFDGTNGFKMAAGQDGRPEMKRFTVQEIRFAKAAPGLEGPLIDFRGKGNLVDLLGTEQIDGRMNYRIGVTLGSGEHQTVWVDAESFLESRYDRATYGPNGPKGVVSVRYRDYKVVEGLAIPSVFEIGGSAAAKPDRMVIEAVALNPEIDDRDFDVRGGARDRDRRETGAAPR